MRRKMIIDFHTHTFPDAIAEKAVAKLQQNSHTHRFSDGTVGTLSANAKKAGIDLSVVMPVVTNPLSTEKINRAAAKVNAHTKETGVFSFGGIHPDTPDYKGELKLIQQLGLKGVKLHPAYQQVNLNDIRYKRIISYAQELDLIVLSHGGLDIGIPGYWSTPRYAAEILDEIKPKNFVLAHMGGWELWEDVKNFLCGREIYLDTAFSFGDIPYLDEVPQDTRQSHLSEEEFLSIIKMHEADKILFGTDSPWNGQAEQLKLMKNLPLNSEALDKILGGNAAELLNL